MAADDELTRSGLRTPRAAAIAGILFSLLLVATILLLRLSATGDVRSGEPPAAVDPRRVAVALHLIPFVGISFLWFVGVLRDRLSQREDRLFATVFLGSAILFLAMLFAGAAVMGAIIITSVVQPPGAAPPQTIALARALTSNIVNIYAIKMAAVFMIVTSTMARKTGIAPRWIVWVGFASSLPLLLGSRVIDWGFLVFPGWVMLISVHVLVDNLRRKKRP